MEPHSSLPCSKEPATDLCTNRGESNKISSCPLKKCRKRFDAETFWKAAIWKTEKKMESAQNYAGILSSDEFFF
jgi:hypothetical protein